MRGGSSEENPKVKESLADTVRPQFIFLKDRTVASGASIGSDGVDKPAHLRLLEFLLLDSILTTQTFLSLGFLFYAALACVGTTAAHRAWSIRAAFIAASVRYSVDFARALISAHVNLDRDGLETTAQKVHTTSTLLNH
jgi:hypothetical protein